MPKNIILYNLKEGVSDEDYQKWCEDYKGPLLLSLNASRAFTLVKMFGGIKGDGRIPGPPEETPSPYNYVGILDVTDLDEAKKDSETAAFRDEFFPQWVSNWVADYFVLAGIEAFEGKSS